MEDPSSDGPNDAEQQEVPEEAWGEEGGLNDVEQQEAPQEAWGKEGERKRQRRHCQLQGRVKYPEWTPRCTPNAASVWGTWEQKASPRRMGALCLKNMKEYASGQSQI